LAKDSRIRGRTGWLDDVHAGSGSRDTSVVQHDVRMGHRGSEHRSLGGGDRL
jgi:hypothetical protein